MKKIVALALCLIMALSLATVAFAAVPKWTEGNGGVNAVDIYAMNNTKTGSDTMTYTAAVAPVLNSDGTLKTAGNIAYYTFAGIAGKYVMSTAYDADAAFAVKAADPSVAAGKQTTTDALYFMIKVDAVTYGYTGELYTAWGTKCGQYVKPDDAATVDYVHYTSVDERICPTLATANDNNDYCNVLVDGVVYTANTWVKVPAVAHTWVVATTKLDKNNATVPVTYKCTTCGTVGTVVASPFDPAAAGHTVEQLAEGVYVYFDYTAPGAAAKAADGVKSAQTFDAGVALYAGMALMSVAGSAVVIGKKKEF